MSDPQVYAATMEQLSEVAPLFDAYRVWYGEEPDPDGAYNFLAHRLRNGESTIFVATLDDTAVGFTQLYPLFSSASMASIWLLNDLFVVESCRGRGVGLTLLETAAEFGRQTGAVRLELEVRKTNAAAKALYARHGWTKNETHEFYSLQLE